MDKTDTAGNWKASPHIALAALVAVTAIWGYTFLIVQDAVSRMPVMDFMAWRFALAAAVMALLRPSSLRHISKKELLHGSILGVVLGLGYATQTFGLQYASAAVSGFITGMFVVLTPVITWIIFRHATDLQTWLLVALATVGVALLSLSGWEFGWGELLTLGCAIFFAFHVVGLGEWSPLYDPYTFTLIQLTTVAAVSLVAALPGGISLPPDIEAWKTIVITAVFATALAFVVQVWAQSLVTATRAAIVMTMEPVFAGVFAVFIGGDQLSPRALIGGACIIAAMLVINIRSNRSKTAAP
jgi:drug/metabolite transporter (DMT)-like permease